MLKVFPIYKTGNFVKFNSDKTKEFKISHENLSELLVLSSDNKRFLLDGVVSYTGQNHFSNETVFNEVSRCCQSCKSDDFMNKEFIEKIIGVTLSGVFNCGFSCTLTKIKPLIGYGFLV